MYFGPLVASIRADGQMFLLSDANKFEAAKRVGLKGMPGLVIEGLTHEQEAQICHKLYDLTEDEHWTVCSNREEFMTATMTDFDPGHSINKVLLCETCRLNSQWGLSLEFQ